MKFIIDIPDVKLTQFKDNFLLAYPKPTIFTGTDMEWFQTWIVGKAKRAYNIGRRKSFEDEIGITITTAS